MKAVWMVCSQCNGSGQIDYYIPHYKEPAMKQCPQCKGEHWANDQSCIAVCAPDSSPLPELDSMGRKASGL